MAKTLGRKTSGSFIPRLCGKYEFIKLVLYIWASAINSCVTYVFSNVFFFTFLLALTCITRFNLFKLCSILLNCYANCLIVQSLVNRFLDILFVCLSIEPAYCVVCLLAALFVSLQVNARACLQHSLFPLCTFSMHQTCWIPCCFKALKHTSLFYCPLTRLKTCTLNPLALEAHRSNRFLEFRR